MILKLTARNTAKNWPDSSAKRRREIFSNDPGHWFTPKDYPSIFLDQRLSSRFNRYTLFGTK